MTEDERIVLAAWEGAEFRCAPGVFTGRILCPTPFGGEWILSGNTNTPFERSHSMDRVTAWSAARAFTEERLEQIRQVEEEIQYLALHLRSIKLAIEGAYEMRAPANLEDDQRDYSTVCRILAREQAALAELKYGMIGGRHVR